MKTLLLFSVLVLSFVGIVGCVSRSIPANVTTQPAAQSSPASKPPTAVFLGDSITALWSQEGFGLSEWSQHPEWNNKGIIGQTSGQISARFDSDVVALHPDIVIICVGVNNVYPGFTLGPSEIPLVFGNYSDSPADVESMVAQAKAAGIKVILALIPPWNCDDQTICALATKADPTLSRYDRISEWNGWLTQFAFDHGITLLDYHTPLMAADGERYQDAMTHDGVHFSSLGYSTVYPLVQAAINQAEVQ